MKRKTWRTYLVWRFKLPKTQVFHIITKSDTLFRDIFLEV